MRISRFMSSLVYLLLDKQSIVHITSAFGFLQCYLHFYRVKVKKVNASAATQLAASTSLQAFRCKTRVEIFIGQKKWDVVAHLTNCSIVAVPSGEVTAHKARMKEDTAECLVGGEPDPFLQNSGVEKEQETSRAPNTSCSLDRYRL